MNATPTHARAAVALVAALALTACAPAAPDGPPGTVTEHYKVHVKRATKYRIKVRPDNGGDTVTIRVWEDEQQACQVGDHYPQCLAWKA